MDFLLWQKYSRLMVILIFGHVAIAKDAHPNEIDKEMDDMDQIILDVLLEAQQNIKNILSKYSINHLAKGQH